MQRERRIRHCCAAVLAAAAMGTSGCTDSGEPLMIVQNQVPEEGCVVPSDQSSNFLSGGVIDVASADGYLFTPLVQSLATEDDSGRSTRVVAVKGADVEVTFPEGLFSSDEETDLRDETLTRFSQAFSGSVFPGAFTSFAFQVLPAALLERIGEKLAAGEETQVSVDVVIFGDMDGNDVESIPFTYPILVCDGCLKVDRGDCATLPDDFEAEDGGTCNPLQDGRLDCCTTGGAEVCPAAPSS